MSTLHITRGLPASGKTTWAKAWVAEDPENRARVNRDDTRLNVYGKPHGLSHRQEDKITKVQSASVETLLRAGVDVVVDDTNLNAKFAKDWLKLAARIGAEVEWHDEFLDVDLRDCVMRDNYRGQGQVGQHVIVKFYDRYLRGGKPKRPELDAAESVTTKPYTGTPGKPKAFLVDLDGTIADFHTSGHRGPHDYHKVGEDDPVEKVIAIVRMLEDSGLTPVYLSGRKDSCRDQTWDWIDKHVYEGHLNAWVDDQPRTPECARDLQLSRDRKLFMRATPDNRRDSIVKLEIFDNEIRDNYDVQFCLDDRDQVVAAYRSIGLTVLQVAPGAF